MKFIGSLILLAICGCSFGQDSIPTGHGPVLGTAISHGGVTTELGWQYHRSSWKFEVGLKLDVSEINPPLEGPWGIYQAVSYSVLSDKPIQPLVRLDQRLSFLEQRCASCPGFNYEYELIGGYGIRWKVTPKWSLEHTFGMGVIKERFQSELSGFEYEQKTSRFNSLTRLSISRAL